MGLGAKPSRRDAAARCQHFPCPVLVGVHFFPHSALSASLSLTALLHSYPFTTLPQSCLCSPSLLHVSISFQVNPTQNMQGTHQEPLTVCHHLAKHHLSVLIPFPTLQHHHLEKPAVILDEA